MQVVDGYVLSTSIPPPSSRAKHRCMRAPAKESMMKSHKKGHSVFYALSSADSTLQRTWRLTRIALNLAAVTVVVVFAAVILPAMQAQKTSFSTALSNIVIIFFANLQLVVIVGQVRSAY